jgi:hypothetical protein
MKHFKNPENNEIFAYESDGSQDEFIPEHLVAISDEEADVIRTEIADAVRQQYLDSLSYQEKRAMEYPPFTDYLDGIVKGDATQVQDYITACLAVKEKYPKI